MSGAGRDLSRDKAAPCSPGPTSGLGRAGGTAGTGGQRRTYTCCFVMSTGGESNTTQSRLTCEHPPGGGTACGPGTAEIATAGPLVVTETDDARRGSAPAAKQQQSRGRAAAFAPAEVPPGTAGDTAGRLRSSFQQVFLPDLQ